MENTKPTPSESDNDNQENTSSKRRSREFLTYYQRLLGRRPSLEQALNSSETEEDDEEEEKPRKWRNFFKGLFTNVVTPPTGDSSEEKQHGFNPDAWYAWQMASNIETNADNTEDAEQSVVESTTIEAPEEAIISPDAALLTEVGDDSSPSGDSIDGVPVDIPEQTIELPVPMEFEATIPHNTPAAESAQPVVERETVIERGVGGGLPLLLVGAEYLGRKRADKQLKKEFAQKIQSAERKDVQHEATQAHLQDLIQQNKEQLEILKRERGMVEARQETIQLPRPEMNPNLPPPEERVPTSRILESVVDAAEHNVPVERVFERSHEVKDDQSTASTVADSGASSIGAVIATQLAQRQPVVGRPQTDIGQGLPVVDEQTARDIYAQAMKSGFIGAIMLIILGLVAYLVIQ